MHSSRAKISLSTGSAIWLSRALSLRLWVVAKAASTDCPAISQIECPDTRTARACGCNRVPPQSLHGTSFMNGSR